MTEYSLIIPAYNEELFIKSSLDSVHKYLKEHKLLPKTEVIVVAADGTDKTKEIAKKTGKKFTHFKLVEPGPKVGKGRDVKAGIEAASSRYRIFFDADLATPLHHLDTTFKAFDEGYEVVYGTRNLWSIHDKFSRKISSVGANLLVRLLLLPKVKDSQCGFKGFDWKTAKVCFDKMTILGWGFDMEVLKIADIYRLNMKSLYIPDWKDPKGEQGLVGESTITATIKTFKELLTIRIKAWKGKYS